MALVDWLRALLASVGFLVALLSLRHSVDIFTQNKARRGDPDAPDVDWSGIAAFAILAVATSTRMLLDIGTPFQGFSAAYGVAYLLAGWSLTRAYRIPLVERLVQRVERRKAPK